MILEASKMIQNNHPYKDLEGTELWKKVSQCIDDLVKNQDINITTQKELPRKGDVLIGEIINNLT